MNEYLKISIEEPEKDEKTPLGMYWIVKGINYKTKKGLISKKASKPTIDDVIEIFNKLYEKNTGE